MTGDTERDIELVPASAVEQAIISRLGDCGSAILTGVVTGVAPSGRKAVAGASVGIEIDMDFNNATTLHRDPRGLVHVFSVGRGEGVCALHCSRAPLALISV
jgi:hypothetical protein